MLHDNAKPHTTNRPRELLRRYAWKVLDRPPDSPNLPSSDFHLFGPKKLLSGRRFATNGEAQQAVIYRLLELDTDFYYVGIEALVSG